MTREEKTELFVLGLAAYTIWSVFHTGESWIDSLFGGEDENKMPDWTDPKYAPQAMQVEAQKTPADYDTMQQAFAKGYRNITGEMPSARVWAMFLAVSAQETDEWRAMWNWNPGNMTTTGQRGYFVIPGTDPKYRYSPFPDADTGAQAMVAMFGRKFPKSFGLMLANSPEEVAAMMKKEGYYEGPEDAYAKRMRMFYDKYLPKLPGPVSGADMPIIRMGDSGTVVQKWQEIIGVRNDGRFGPVTDKATKEWQEDRGLNGDGIVGPETWAVALSEVNENEGSNV